ncbi:MAG: hypothetical protein RLZZ584_3615, partial [Pseudomonadota bacterium]
DWSTNQPNAAQAMALFWGVLITLGVEAALWAWRRRARHAAA